MASLLSFFPCLYFKPNLLFRTFHGSQTRTASGHGIIQSGPPEIVCLSLCLSAYYYNYSHALKFLHCYLTLCTRHSIQRDCWMQLGTLRQFKVCSSQPNFPFFQTCSILLFLHWHFSPDNNPHSFLRNSTSLYKKSYVVASFQTA